MTDLEWLRENYPTLTSEQESYFVRKVNHYVYDCMLDDDLARELALIDLKKQGRDDE